MRLKLFEWLLHQLGELHQAEAIATFRQAIRQLQAGEELLQGRGSSIRRSLWRGLRLAHH